MAMMVGSHETSAPFDRDVIICPDMLIQNVEEGYPYASTLLPIVNAVWQGAGRGRTPYTNIFSNSSPSIEGGLSRR